MRKKLTITVDKVIYERLHATVGNAARAGIKEDAVLETVGDVSETWRMAVVEGVLDS